MAKNERKRQKALEKHRIKRKQVQTSKVSTAISSGKVNIRAAAMWPVKECWISRNWQREGEIMQIVVARESPAGSIAAATACMGVKSAFWSVYPTEFDYHNDLLDECMSTQPMVKTDINTAAKVLHESVAYARQWDIRPDPDYSQASKLLGDADPDASNSLVPLGVGGKPLFTAGPYDNVDLIIAKLERTAGPGNYEAVIMPINPELLFDEVDEDFDEVDEDFDEVDEDDDEMPLHPYRVLPPSG